MRNLSILFFLTIFANQLFASEYKPEKIQFDVDDSVKLNGILYIPREKPINKVIVCFSGGGLEFKTPEDSLQYTFKLMEKLSNEGVGWLIFSSRFYKGFRPLNLFTYASDADSAISYLKQREDTKNCKIGIMGQSEAGMATAVSASRNKDVDFVISVTSFMISGPEFHTYNIFSPENNLTHLNSKSIFDKFEYILKDTFVYNNKTYINSHDLFISCMKDCLDSITRSFYSNDSIASILASDKLDLKQSINTSLMGTDMFKRLWNINDTLQDFKPDYNGVKTKDIIDFLVFKLFNPHDIAFMQWNPEKYFSRITVPTLVLLADKDGLMPFKENLTGINDIVRKYNNKNITVKVFKNHTHGLVTPKKLDKSDISLNKSETPNKTANWISSWIERQE